MTRSSLRNILGEDLKYHPYKIQITQELQDYQKWSDFANRFLQLAENEDFINNLFMTDEIHLHPDGYVNKQTARFWAFENFKVIHQRPVHAANVRVYGVASRLSESLDHIFRRCIWYNAVSINGDQYRRMIREYLLPEMRNMNVDNIFFQQDANSKSIIRNVNPKSSTLFFIWQRHLRLLPD